jgi:NRPS condensation-like uncharacterized protein
VIAPASYAQARIWLDERVRFHSDKPQMAIYNMPFVYRVSPDHTLSIKQLRHALQLVINKHQSLRTSVKFDFNQKQLMQRYIDQEYDENNQFIITESIFKTDEELKNIIHDEQYNSRIFDIVEGLVFRCHILYYEQIATNDFLCNNDVLIFNFHHALFDLLSLDIFLDQLNQAYTTNQLLINEGTTLRYLDCKYSCLLLLFHYISFLSMII